VLNLLSNNDALTRRRLTIEIDTHTRLGEYYYRTKEYITAEKELQAAIRLVEQNQRMKLIGQESIFGRPYADLGDLSYYIQGDLATAGTAYQAAIVNTYIGPELTYKIGYIQYVGQDFRDALTSFSSAEDASSYPSGIEPLVAVLPGGAAATEGAGAQSTANASGGAANAQPAAGTQTATASGVASAPARSGGGRVPVNLLFALGNCFYQRGDYFAAQGYYLQVKDRLETRRTAAGTLLPEVKPEDRALLQYLVKVYNNLGVTMIRISERMGDRKTRSEGLVTLTNATEIADSLARFTSSPEREADPSRRNETRSIPSLNMRGILYPLKAKFDLQIYQPIAKDFEAIGW
jgi:tetratricopeptide (TPR) repeat protein